MTTARLALLLAVLAAGCASRSPAAPSRPDRAGLPPGGLAAVFAECVGILGPTRDLPVAGPEILQSPTMGGRFPLPSEGNVRDGYQHWLVTDHVTKKIYIVQVGGFAGFMTVFGPFTAEDGCRTVPADLVPWYWDLA